MRLIFASFHLFILSVSTLVTPEVWADIASVKNSCAEFYFDDIERDYFLRNPPRQPKAEIADYMVSQRFLTPKRFVDLKEALAEGGPVIMRSEHPMEYTSASGVFESYVITADLVKKAQSTFITEAGLEALLVELGERARRRQPFDPSEVLTSALGLFLRNEITQARFEHIMFSANQGSSQFLKFVGKRLKYIAAEKSFSYWKKLDGINNYIVEDPMHPGRFIISGRKSEGDLYLLVIQNDKVLEDIGGTNVIPMAKKLISYYKAVQVLSRFDPKHSPVLEVQWLNDKPYFLQYHRTPALAETSFSLSRTLEESEVKSHSVAGVTPPEGIKVTIKLKKESSNFSLVEENRLRTIEINGVIKSFRMIVKNQNTLENERTENFHELRDLHALMDMKTVPTISLISSKELVDLVPSNVATSVSNGESVDLVLRIISDGRKAYIKIISAQKTKSVEFF